MGMGYSNPQFEATNYVLDYSINLLHPDRYGQIMQRLGPNVNNFPAQGKNQVLSDFNECLSTGNPQIASEYHKLRQISFGAIGLFILGFVVFAIVAMSFKQGYSFAIILLIALWIAGIVAFCVISGKQRVLAQQWRSEIIQKLQSKMSVWKAMYPAFTFTLIYPVEVWRRSGRSGRRRRRLVAVWCYVRVTQGPCTTGHNEPIYATTTNQVAAAPMVQQHVQQQPQQVMVQTANGQYVQGTPAMVNGQQVIMVQQPVTQQPVQYQQQPVMIQQQQQQYPGTNSGYPGAPR